MRFFDGTIDPEHLPSWLSDDALETYVDTFTRTGLTGALNWYRAMDVSWELMAPFAGARVRVPALFLYGDQDPTLPLQLDAIGRLGHYAPHLRETVALKGAGHWIQHERAGEVNQALVGFASNLPAPA